MLCAGLVFLVFLAACGSSASRTTSHPKPPPHGPQGELAAKYTGSGPKVAIIGDSLTMLGWDRLYDDLTANFQVRIAAWYGEGYDGGPFSVVLKSPQPILEGAAASIAESKPSIVVLALGTNDVWSQRNTSQAQSTMRAMVDMFPGACMVGVTLPEQSDAQSWSPSEARALNDAMRQWAHVVVDWATLSRRPGMLGSDHLHTTAAGTRLRADAIASAVEKCHS